MKNLSQLVATDIRLVHTQFMNAQLITPESFTDDEVTEIVLGTAPQLSFDTANKRARLGLKLVIISGAEAEVNANNPVPVCEFDLRFIFEINRFEEYIQDTKKGLVVSGDLMVSLASIAYSTARGMLISRLQNTVFSRVILPVLDPKELVRQMEEAIIRDTASVNA